MRKNLLYLIIFILLLISLGFLYSKNKTQAENHKTIVFWTLQLGIFDKYINNIISEYESSNPDIKIKWIDIPYSEGEKRTLASVLTDNPPDLVNLTPDFSLLLAQRNALYTFSEDNLSQFIPSVNETLKYEDKYFGIPFYATSAVTLYNTDLTSKIKNLPKTYDNLFSLCVPSGNYLTMINFSENDTLLKILNKYNINSPETITSTKSIELFNEFKKLYDNNLIPKESITQTHRDALEKYMSGKIAFLVTGANFINMIKENAPSVYKKTKVLPQLTGETGLYDFSLMNFVIPDKAKNKKEALDFALFFTNKKNQLDFAKMTTILPVNKYCLEDEYFKISKDNDLSSNARIISVKQLDKLQPQIKNVKNKKELNTISSNCIQEILINNTNIKNSLQKFSSEWNKL